MVDQALIRSILESIKNGEREIDITPKGLKGADAATFKDTMHRLEDRGLIAVKHKHLGGVWEIEGLTATGEAYLKDQKELRTYALDDEIEKQIYDD